MKEMTMRLFKEEDGQGLVEYGLILALVAVVVIGALTLLGQGVKKNFTEVESQLNGTAAAPAM